MKSTVVLSCFAGQGIALRLLFLVFSITAVPTPPPSSSPQTFPDVASSSVLGTADTAVTSSSILSQTISTAPTNLPQDNDPPAIINNENVTETEIVITEARHGKSLHHHHNQPHDSIIKFDGDTNGATTVEPTDSNFSVKLAQDGDHVVQHIEAGDAPPKNDTDEKSSKPQELQESQMFSLTTTLPVPTERDKMIQRIFGGECDFAHWTRCSRLKFWGGDYLVPDKNNPGQFIVKHHKIRCVESPGYTLCLRNGWTVARCHMLCMSQCNVEFRMNFEKLVSHEGDCRNPLLLGK